MFIDGEFKTIKSDVEKCTDKKEYLIFLKREFFKVHWKTTAPL